MNAKSSKREKEHTRPKVSNGRMEAESKRRDLATGDNPRNGGEENLSRPFPTGEPLRIQLKALTCKRAALLVKLSRKLFAQDVGFAFAHNWQRAARNASEVTSLKPAGCVSIRLA